jgi:hypothetical protein
MTDSQLDEDAVHVEPIDKPKSKSGIEFDWFLHDN